MPALVESAGASVLDAGFHPVCDIAPPPGPLGWGGAAYFRRVNRRGNFMAKYPATTVRVISIEPHGETQVCIKMEMIADVHRLAEVGSDMLHASIAHMKKHGLPRKA